MNAPAKAGRIGGAAGLLSFALLAASIKWAHHWGVRADLRVACWGLTTVGAIRFSVRSVRASHRVLDDAPALAKLGIWLAAVSVATLVVAGIAAAAGMDPAGACGGG